MKRQTVPLFSPGMLSPDPDVLVAAAQSKSWLPDILARYLACDWGVTGTERKRANDEAVQSGGIIVASYLLLDGTVIEVSTAEDRSETTVALAAVTTQK